jgi:hypothetical protein
LIEIEVGEQGLAPAMDSPHRQQASERAFADAPFLADERCGGRGFCFCHPGAVLNAFANQG